MYLQQADPTFQGGSASLLLSEKSASHLFMTISQKKMTRYLIALIAADMIPGKLDSGPNGTFFAVCVTMV